MLPRIVTQDSILRVFQYKLLNNVLYLNKCFSGLEKLLHLSAPSVNDRRNATLRLL